MNYSFIMKDCFVYATSALMYIPVHKCCDSQWECILIECCLMFVYMGFDTPDPFSVSGGLYGELGVSDAVRVWWVFTSG